MICSPKPLAALLQSFAGPPLHQLCSLYVQTAPVERQLTSYARRIAHWSKTGLGRMVVILRQEVISACEQASSCQSAMQWPTSSHRSWELARVHNEHRQANGAAFLSTSRVPQVSPANADMPQRAWLQGAA